VSATPVHLTPWPTGDDVPGREDGPREGPAGGVVHPAPDRRTFLLALTVLFIVGAGDPDQEEVGEYRAKADYMVRFAAYTEWSKAREHQERFVLGVLGPDPFGKDLEAAVERKQVRGRPIELRRFKRLEEIGAAHLLFVSKLEKTPVARIAAKVARDNVLLVGETEGFVKAGGLVGFYFEEDKLRFEIDPSHAKTVGIKFRAALLRLARIVKED